MASSVAVVAADLRHDMGREHSENRTRLQDIADKTDQIATQAEANFLFAKESALVSDKVLLRVEMMYGSNGTDGALGRAIGKIDNFEDTVRELIGEVREMAGKESAKKEIGAQSADKKKDQITTIKWIIGILSSTGAGTWLLKHFKLL